MNKKLSKEIFKIVHSLNEKESTNFYQRANKKVKAEKSEKKYFTLFRRYQSQLENYPDLDETKLKYNLEDLTGSFDDLQQDLHDELIRFIETEYVKSTEGAREKKINSLIDQAIGLHKRGLTSIALRKILKANELIYKDSNTHWTNHKDLFLILKAYEWWVEIRHNSNETEDEKQEFDSHEKDIYTFLQIARMIYTNNKKGENFILSYEADKADSNFEQLAFYSLLYQYYRNNELWDKVFGNNPTFGPLDRTLNELKMKRNNEENEINELVNTAIKNQNYFLLQFEKLNQSILTNNKWNFEEAYGEIVHDLGWERNKNIFTAEFTTLVSSYLFEILVSQSMKNNSEEKLNKLESFQVYFGHALNLLSEDNVPNTALRFEINNVILYFMKGEYDSALKSIRGVKNIPKIDTSLILNLEFLELICKIELRPAQKEDWQDNFSRIESLLKRKTEMELVFEKQFAKLLDKYLYKELNVNKTELNLEFNKLKKGSEEYGAIQLVLLHWVEGKAKFSR